MLRAKNSRYIMLNSPVAALDDIKAILPGSQSPTVMRFQGRDVLKLVRRIVRRRGVLEHHGRSRGRGASSILVVRLKRCLIERSDD